MIVELDTSSRMDLSLVPCIVLQSEQELQLQQLGQVKLRG